MNAKSVNQQSFEKDVLNNTKPVLVDFWANWCGPCKMLSPVLEELAAEHTEIEVCKVNVDENPELTMAYRVSAIPAVMLFKNGRVISQTVGFQSKQALEELIK